jgi:phenylalanyl-tRNA synthetase beta chain
MNNSLTNNKLNISKRREITIINSISSDISQLRTTMLDSMLKTLKFNLNRKNSNNKFFEFGKIYEYNEDNLNKESRRLGILFYGDLYKDNWNKTENKEPYFILKNLVLNIFKKLSIEISEIPISYDGFEKALGLFNEKEKIGIIGNINTEFKSKYELKNQVYYASLDMDLILKLTNKNFKKYSTLSKFPSVKRELNFLLDSDINFSSIENLILKKSNIKNLDSMSLSDVYEDKKLPDGKKSYTLNFNLSDKTKTLSDKEISSTMNKIQTKIETEYKAQLRS